MHCMAEAWERAAFCTEPSPWEPRFGPSPGLGCAEQRAQTGGTGGSLPTHCISQGEQIPLGSPDYCPVDRLVPQDTWKCPNSCFY